jgi:hypothetical protein
VVDLLQLGFELRAAQRHGPEDSTNGAFEEILYFQRGSLLLKCYDELTLSARSDSARVTSSRSACQQVVPSRLRPRDVVRSTGTQTGREALMAIGDPQHEPPAKPTPEPRSPATGETKSEREAREKAERDKACKPKGDC